MNPNYESLTRLQFFTQSTCGDACWHAREEICRCSCGGKNHGILNNGGERPARTCKISGYWYKLHTVTSYGDAVSLCFELRKADSLIHPEKYEVGYDSGEPMVYYSSKPGDAYHSKAATAGQLKWTEVENAGIESDYICMVWERIPNPVKP